MFEKKQSVNQDFKKSYSRIIRINTQFKLHCTHQYTAEDLNQFYQDYLKLIQYFNLIQRAVQEQIKMIRKGFKKKRHNQFYTSSPHRATFSLLCTTCKESSINSINCFHTINQPISTSRKISTLLNWSTAPTVSNQFQQKHQANSYSPN